MNNKKILIFSAIVFFVSVITTGTVAYYRYGVSGLIKASVGNYTFNVSSGSTTTKEINLGSNLKPFDKGSFNLTVNLNNTDSDAYFSVKIERTNLPKGFKFLAQDDNISPFSTYSKTFKSTDTKSDTVTVYWYWDGNVDDENDTGFVGKNLSADIVIDSKQMNGAYMKNGYSAKSEFWSDTYRTYIRTVSFVKNISNVPSTCDEANLCWDVTESGTKKVYAYLVDSGLKDSTDNTKTLYNLYIASEVEIIAPIICEFMFRNFTNLIKINFNNMFYTFNTTNMRGMFYECLSLASLDLSNFNTSNVTNSAYMFCTCSSLISLDLSNFNTLNVTDMTMMFAECSSLTSLDLGSFNTSNVTNMQGMFVTCNILTSLDLNSFNTLNVTDMTGMFQKCSSLTNLELNNFNTLNVTNMAYMFTKCSSLTILNLNNFSTSNVTNMAYMFNGCSSLTTLDLSSFNTSIVTNMPGMFQNCSSLTNLELNNFNTLNVTNMSSMFNGCSSLITLNLSSFNTSKVTNMKIMFQNCSSLTNLNLNNFSTLNVTNMGWMFNGCSLLTTLDLSSFNTASVTDMRCMFQNCSSLAILKLGTFNTINVSNMGWMFYNCSKLTTTINIMSANTTDYTRMFQGAATASGAKITVNYTSATSSLVDSMIATKSSSSNVVKGSLIS